MNTQNNSTGGRYAPSAGSTFPDGIEETWRADAAEQRVCELEHDNAILREMLQKMYDAPTDCSCAPSDETLAIWEEARIILSNAKVRHGGPDDNE